MRRSVTILSLLCGAAIVTGLIALAWHGQPGGGTLAWSPHEDPAKLGQENIPEALVGIAEGLDRPVRVYSEDESAGQAVILVGPIDETV